MSLTSPTKDAPCEVEFWFFLCLGFSAGNHFNGGSRTIAAAEPAACAFFDVVSDFSAETLWSDSFFEGVSDRSGFAFDNVFEDFSLHCANSRHFLHFTLVFPFFIVLEGPTNGCEEAHDVGPEDDEYEHE